jgi:hypothetical protein
MFIAVLSDYNTIITIIPPILTSILAGMVAMKKSKVSHIKTVTEMQVKALEIVSKAEEKMREEIRMDLEIVKAENRALKLEIDELKNEAKKRSELIDAMKTEIISLKATIIAYKKQIILMEKINKDNCNLD